MLKPKNVSQLTLFPPSSLCSLLERKMAALVQDLAPRAGESKSPRCTYLSLVLGQAGIYQLSEPSYNKYISRLISILPRCRCHAQQSQSLLQDRNTDDNQSQRCLQALEPSGQSFSAPSGEYGSSFSGDFHASDGRTNKLGGYDRSTSKGDKAYLP